MAEESENIPRPFDEAEFEFLFKSRFAGLVLFAQRYVKDFDLARDIVHDAFIALWEKRDSIDLNLSVASWLATAVHNKSLNYLRDNRKFDRNLLAAEHLLDVPGPLFDEVVSEETQKIIHEAIQELSEKCREVFTLNRFENLKYHEIALKLDISVKTVETHMSKALQHLRIKLLPYLKLLLWLWMLRNH